MKSGPLGLMVPDDDWHAGTIYEDSRRYDYFRPHFKKGGIVVDGGAHVGYWSLRMSEDFDKVLAFEPNKPTFDCLAWNVNLFPKQNVNISKVALGASSGLGKMVLGGRQGNSGAWYVKASDDPLAQVPIIPLDSHINGMKLNLIKLDLEGMERDALLGGESWISRDKPAIIIERNIASKKNLGIDKNAAHDLLESWGYKVLVSFGKDYLYTLD